MVPSVFSNLLTMADKVDTASPVDAPPAEEKKLKACCACPETKKARDEW